MNQLGTEMYSTNSVAWVKGVEPCSYRNNPSPIAKTSNPSKAIAKFIASKNSIALLYIKSEWSVVRRVTGFGLFYFYSFIVRLLKC